MLGAASVPRITNSDGVGSFSSGSHSSITPAITTAGRFGPFRAAPPRGRARAL